MEKVSGSKHVVIRPDIRYSSACARCTGSKLNLIPCRARGRNEAGLWLMDGAGGVCDSGSERLLTLVSWK
jgi:hypothetical protein